MPEPTDKVLYEKVKGKIYKEIPTHSAYRSGRLVSEYKKEFKKKYPRKSPYKGKKPDDTTGLNRWFKEEWRNQRGDIGYSKKGDIYRPTKKVTKDTPITFKELSKSEIKRAQKEKKTKGRVKKFKK